MDIYNIPTIQGSENTKSVLKAITIIDLQRRVIDSLTYIRQTKEM
jgi:hypothetical protein